jgi:hypothetical protein
MGETMKTKPRPDGSETLEQIQALFQRWRDNVFVEHLWRSVKYEEVYLKAYESVPEARTSLAQILRFLQ